MAIEHKDIPNSDLHEPKDISNALQNEVYIADGASSGSWGAYPIGATAVSSVFSAASASDQQPVGLDIPLQVEFGAAQSTPDFFLDTAGGLTVNTSGVYLVNFAGRMARTVSAGTATVMIRYLVNGAAQPFTTAQTLESGAFSIPFTSGRTLSLTAGDVLTVEIMRDSSGANDGGLTSFTPVDSSWAPCPSAAIVVSKLETVR
jgi:hypothetical protein